MKTITNAKRRLEANKGQDGFTLIELLIVIAILGILAAIVVFAVSNMTSESAESACKADARTVQTAVEAHRAANPSYATAMSALVPTYLKSAPTSNRYAVALGTGAGGNGVGAFAAGTVVVAPPGTALNAATGWQDATNAVAACDAVVA